MAPPRLLRRAREVVCPRIPGCAHRPPLVRPPWPTRPVSGPGPGVFKDAFERRAETLEVPLEDESEERLGQASPGGKKIEELVAVAEYEPDRVLGLRHIDGPPVDLPDPGPQAQQTVRLGHGGDGCSFAR